MKFCRVPEPLETTYVDFKNLSMLGIKNTILRVVWSKNGGGGVWCEIHPTRQLFSVFGLSSRTNEGFPNIGTIIIVTHQQILFHLRQTLFLASGML